MPPPVDILSPTPLFGLTAGELDTLVKSWEWPAFRGRQLREWVYGKGVLDPRAMTNLAARERETLSQRVAFLTGDVVANQLSADGTRKLLLAWENGKANAETVMIPDGDRRTACVSSQVGCPVGCKFCASGIAGVKGNLTAAQIVEQVVWLNLGSQARRLEGTEAQSERANEVSAPSSLRALGETQSSRVPSCLPPSITNVVFMGMGEPLANYANVMQAIRVLHDPEGLNIGARRITISTVGVPAKMRELAQEALPINLAISLHAPNEPLRKQLIPWAEHFALDEILDAARDYFQQTGREITLEYILLSGVNDRPEHARELARLCKTLRSNVNLIRYNEVSALPYKRPVARDVVVFQDILRSAGVNAHVRKSRGRDIDAACGQLRRKEGEKLVTLGK